MQKKRRHNNFIVLCCVYVCVRVCMCMCMHTIILYTFCCCCLDLHFIHYNYDVMTNIKNVVQIENHKLMKLLLLV